MAINPANVNVSIQQFEAISSGECDFGELRPFENAIRNGVAVPALAESVAEV